MADVRNHAPTIVGKVGLRIGWGPGKTELMLPQGFQRDSFPYPLDVPNFPAPQVVRGFQSYLGVPRHSGNDLDFITNAMVSLGEKHDRLLDMTEEIADENPFATLRLLQMCGVSRFGHVLSAVPPYRARDFARARK